MMAKQGAGRKVRAPAREAVRWSQERETLFLETLAQNSNVAQAVRTSGLSSASVYRRRDASEAFRSAWLVALREGYVRLETELLRRALNGVRKPVWHGGKKVGSIVEYSDRLALTLLAQHRATIGGQVERRGGTDAEARAALIDALAKMNRGMGGEG